ncbi:MAG: serine hydrolase [Pseudomonadota bacterium]
MRSFSRDNWLTPPYNRESFQQVQSLFPTARLRKGTAEPTAWGVDPLPIDHISFRGTDREQHTLPEFIAASQTDALLIMREGKLIFEQYGNGMQADSLHLINSISKTFTGMLAGILVGDGLLDPAAPLTDYVPDFAGTAMQGTTLDQALNMTGAVTFSEDYASPGDDFWIETAVLGWRPDLASKAGTTSLKRYAYSRTETDQPNGGHLHYRTLLTNVVAMAIEEATRTPVQELMEQRLWQKLKPEYDANIVLDAEGFPYCGAGISATARDLMRFGQMLLDDGMVDGEQVVPANWVQATRNGNERLRQLFAETDYAPMFDNGHYSNQTWASASEGLLVCIGIYGQTIYVHQPSGMVIVKLSTHPAPADDHAYANTFQAMRALVSGLTT